jgi:hypothetical protein
MESLLMFLLVYKKYIIHCVSETLLFNVILKCKQFCTLYQHTSSKVLRVGLCSHWITPPVCAVKLTLLIAQFTTMSFCYLHSVAVFIKLTLKCSESDLYRSWMLVETSRKFQKVLEPSVTLSKFLDCSRSSPNILESPRTSQTTLECSACHAIFFYFWTSSSRLFYFLSTKFNFLM